MALKNKYDQRIDNIEVVGFYPTKLFMVPSIRKTVRFQDPNDSDYSDSESLETKRKKIRANSKKEQWISYNIMLSKMWLPKHLRIKGKFQDLLGFEFPSGDISYIKVKIHKTKNFIVAMASNFHSVIFHYDIQDRSSFIGFMGTLRCYHCNRAVKKIYRCFDCRVSLPPNAKHSKFVDSCKTCYSKREHVGHRSILLESIFNRIDDYEYLEDLI